MSKVFVFFAFLASCIPFTISAQSALPAKRYIVQLQSSPPLIASAEELAKEHGLTLQDFTALSSRDRRKKDILDSLRAKEETLQQGHADLLAHARRLGARTKDLPRFTATINALALEMSEKAAQELEHAGYLVSEDFKITSQLFQSVEFVGAPTAWNLIGANNLPLRGHGVTIGILDTGIDYRHPALGACTESQFTTGQCAKVIGGKDFINADNNPMDDHGHGTHVASIAAGSGIMPGVAPEASLVGIKVLDSSGGAFASVIISGIEYALDPNDDGDFSDRLDVINLSLGGWGSPDTPLSLAVDNVVRAGVVAIVAAGNEGRSGRTTITSPGNSREAISVGATFAADYPALEGAPLAGEITSFSSRGPVATFGGNTVYNKPDLSAPGFQICAAARVSPSYSYSCNNLPGYVSLSGTSMAAPHVAGAAALLLQMNPEMTPTQIKTVLRMSARPMLDPDSSALYDFFEYGMGLLDIPAALSLSSHMPKARIEVEGIFGSTLIFKGSASGEGFTGYELAVEDPVVHQWTVLASGTQAMEGGTFTTRPRSQFELDSSYRVRLKVFSLHGVSEDYTYIWNLSPTSPEWFQASDGSRANSVLFEYGPFNGANEHRFYKVIDGFTELLTWHLIIAGGSSLHPWNTAAPDGMVKTFVSQGYSTATGLTSPFSTSDTGYRVGDNDTPLPPVNVAATTNLPNQIKISWEAASAGPRPNRFVIYRYLPTSLSGGTSHNPEVDMFDDTSFNQLTVVNGNVTSYTDYSYAPPGIKMYYLVRADAMNYPRTGGLSHPSAIVAGIRSGSAPQSLVNNFSASQNSPTQIALNWSTTHPLPSGQTITGFKLFRSPLRENCGQLTGTEPIATLTPQTTTYSDFHNFTQGEIYYYSLKALGSGLSAETSCIGPVMGAAALPVPATPLSLEVQQTGKHVALSWSSLSDIENNVAAISLFRSAAPQPCSGTELKDFAKGATEAKDWEVPVGRWYYSMRTRNFTGQYSSCSPVSAIDVRSWCGGDANMDGRVNGSDLSVILSLFGTSVIPGVAADFNLDGRIDGADLSTFLSNFGCGL